MPEPTNDRPTPPAPRLHRLLSNPLGWLAFLCLEVAALYGVITLLPLERFSPGTALVMSSGLIIAAFIVNYRIRRIYLSDQWAGPKR